MDFKSGKPQSHYKVINQTQKKPVVSLEDKDENGCTALHNAIINGSTDKVHMLVKSGADINQR